MQLYLEKLIEYIVVGLWLPIISALFHYTLVLGNITERDREKRRIYLWRIRTYVFGVSIFSIGSLLLLVNKTIFVQFRYWLVENFPLVLGGGVCIAGAIVIALALFGHPDAKFEPSFITAIGYVIGLASLIIEIVALLGG